MLKNARYARQFEDLGADSEPPVAATRKVGSADDLLFEMWAIDARAAIPNCQRPGATAVHLAAARSIPSRTEPHPVLARLDARGGRGIHSGDIRMDRNIRTVDAE